MAQTEADKNTQDRFIVLLVDDQPIIGEALRRMVDPETDIEFHYCAESQDALAMARKLQPTTILQDLVMPDIDGMALLDQYRADPETRDIPVIILSTREDPQDKSDAFSAGASDYLVKVPDKVELIARIRAHSRSYLSQKQRDQLLEELKELHIELEQKNKELEKLSCIDGLTGISNRRHFDTYIAQEWLRALREKSETSLILVDIDYFKPFNDNYGHQAGDECLRKVARCLDGVLHRPGDMAARYGGEEFVLLLPFTDTRGAVKIAEQMREAIRELAISHGHSGVADRLTVSMGVASTVPSEKSNPADLINEADKALYKAKEQGRDRYVIADGTGNEPVVKKKAAKKKAAKKKAAKKS